MSQAEPGELLVELAKLRAVISAWPVCAPDLGAARCEESRHRTLAHLRACQEQWLVVLEAFLAKPGASVTILHPWRQFEVHQYDQITWDDHLSKWLSDRDRWLELCRDADFSIEGKWNRKPETVYGLTNRLLRHEQHHILQLDDYGRPRTKRILTSTESPTEIDSLS